MRRLQRLHLSFEIHLNREVRKLLYTWLGGGVRGSHPSVIVSSYCLWCFWKEIKHER